MSERIGNCEQCGQRFGGIPESITALKVKCTECGGVVSIPPLPEAPVDMAPPAPVAEQASAPTPPPAPMPVKDKPLAAPLGEAKSKAGGRPESAKQVDRNVAAVKKPAPLKPVAKPIAPLRPVVKLAKPIKPLQPVAKPAKPVVLLKKPVAPGKPTEKPVVAKPIAPKPVQAKPVAPKPVAKPVVAAPPVKKAESAKPTVADIIAKARAKKAAEAQPAAAAKPSAADIIAKAKAKREATGTPATKPAVATGGPRKVVLADAKPKVAAGAARKRPAGGGSARSSARRRPQEEEYDEKSKAPMFIIGAIVLIGAGFGAWTLMNGDKAPVSNGEELANVPAESGGTPVVASSDSSTGANTTPAAAESGSTPSAGSTDTSVATGETDASTTEASDPAPQPKASSEFTLPAAGKSIDTRGVSDPALIVLDQVTPLNKAADTSADNWSEAVEDLALYLEDSGASSNRAGNRLAEDYPRAAYPAIINAMMKVDYTTADGLYLAASLNNLLLRIGTKDLSWKATEFIEPGTAEWDEKVAFNKKVVALWHNLWIETYANSISAWNNFSKAPAEGGAVEEADVSGIVGPDDDLFD
ncbi:MAG: hypothetical protein O3A95_01305 [Planctomycetota bacterium]|nr:hypothetical protein [Planctomycetota bacterium]